MAKSTYIQLVNDLLIEVNEVEIPETDFASCVGIWRHAKKAINNALRDIESDQHFWPFNYTEGAQTLTAYTTNYAAPDDMKIIDFDTFSLGPPATDAGEETFTDLTHLSYEEWIKEHRDRDKMIVRNSTGGSRPRYVVSLPSGQFALSPPPDKDYVLTYDYYKSLVVLSDKNDTCSVPEQFEHVIIAGALSWFNLFLDDTAQSNYIKKNLYEPSLKKMRTILINNDFEVFEYRRKTLGGGRVSVLRGS